MNWWQALLLGLVQGVSEWLPISSSGHLVIAQDVLGVEVPLAFDLALHVATLVVVVVAYWPRLWGMLLSLGPSGDVAERGMVFRLLVATLPIVVLGLLARDWIESAFDSTRAVVVGLMITAAFLVSTRFARGNVGGYLGAFVVGCFQAVALWPGVSRSGSSIAGALHVGMDRKDATDFAFMLAIPALVGATVLQAPALLQLGEVGWMPVLIGMAAAGVSGWLGLQGMRAFVAKVGLVPFAPYVLLVAVLASLL